MLKISDSVRGPKNMAEVVVAYLDKEFVQTVPAQIPWSHNVVILDYDDGELVLEAAVQKYLTVQTAGLFLLPDLKGV